MCIRDRSSTDLFHLNYNQGNLPFYVYPDLDYVEERKEEVEEIEPEAMVEEKKIEAEELEVEDNPNRGKSSKVSYLDSNLDEINQYCSTRDSFSESDVHKERVPKVRQKKVRQSG